MKGQWPAITRRAALKGSLVAATGLASAKAGAASAAHLQWLVFDGREILCQHFAKGRLGPRVDIADEARNGWRTFRSPGHVAGVIGLTRWGEFLMARSFLEETALRVAAVSVRLNGLVYWEMRLSDDPGAI